MFPDSFLQGMEAWRAAGGWGVTGMIGVGPEKMDGSVLPGFAGIPWHKSLMLGRYMHVNMIRPGQFMKWHFS